jgi:hypothetical protein
VARHAHDEVLARRALDADVFRHAGHSLPAAGCLHLHRVVGLEALEVQVLHIGAGVGEAPGDVFILAEHDHRQARHRRAGGLEAVRARHFDARDVPQRRCRDLQMRVVGQQRLAARRLRAGDDPVVRAHAFDTRRRRDGLQVVDLLRRQRRQGTAQLQRTQQRRVVGRGQRRVTGIRRQQLVDALDRQRQRQPRAQQLGAPVAAQVPGHHDRPGQAVDRRPVFEWHAEDQHLRRPRCHVLALPGVDARGVGLQHALRFIAELRPLRLRGPAHTERAQELVVVQRRPAEGFGQAAAADAAVRLQLPQPVLRMRKAQTEGRVFDARRADGRNAVLVALDAHLRAEAADAQRTVMQGRSAPDIGGKCRQREQHCHRQCDGNAAQPADHLPR